MKDQAQKAMFAVVGAPLVFSRHLASVGTRASSSLSTEYELWAEEGQKVTKQVRKSDVVEELSNRVDVEQLQGQVEKLRDQMEGALTQWRESFRQETKTADKATPAAPKTKTAAAPKTTAKKAAPKTAAAKKEAPKAAAKKTTPKTGEQA